MGESADFDDAGAIAVSIGNTNLAGTGLAKEAGGNLQTARTMLDGTATGALVGVSGNTVGKEMAAWLAGGAVTGTPGGTPLIHGVKQVFQVLNQVIPASGTFTPANITITKPGYLIQCTLAMSAAGSVQPTLKVDMQWKVAASSNLLTGNEQWYLPCAASGNRRVSGKGPTKGDTLTVTCTNGDTVNSVTLSMTIWETTHHIPRDDWRSDGAVSSAAGGAVGNAMQANLLCTDNFSVPAGTTVTKNLPLYSGQANIFVNQNTAAGSTISLNPGSIFSPAFVATSIVIDWTASAHITTNIALARGYYQLLAFNNGAAAAPCAVSITVLEFAS